MTRLVLLSIALLLLTAKSATGQVPHDTLGSARGYVREVFEFPRFGRENPVAPPAVLTVKDAFPVLILSGIVYNDQNSDDSKAILREEGATTGPPARHVVRAGDRLSQYEIVRVTREEVHINAHQFGAVKRIVLTQGDKVQQTSKASSSMDPATGRPSQPAVQEARSTTSTGTTTSGAVSSPISSSTP